jgi:hypothetical protein
MAETDRSRGYREPQGDNQSPKQIQKKISAFTRSIKALFREAKQAITSSDPTPQISHRRRRRGEKGQAGFTLAARKIMRPVPAPKQYPLAKDYMLDTFAWLHLWEGSITESFDDFHSADHTHDHTLHL